ncbi:HTH-type transcriptional regulator RutR [Pigmentiphaga aceris]|uniref:HTH-type transcriptional regulator RutR n=1 Tax=Pigmentiphaga aceris TaxID=1940612 RepID=A0A5C0ASK7_9BURK|nr:HTH-type transcriptional regulator RutR [Pigmentiphaga aceris]QEI04995.1 HTH-type transcriptional regulator RutR [Pigmentiphaga aceris]
MPKPRVPDANSGLSDQAVSRAARVSRVSRADKPVRPDKRAAILDAALGLFSRFGLHGTSIDQVATRAEVTKGNLLYYFANKEELYVSVLRDLLDVWLAPLREFSVDQAPEQAIGDYIRRKLAMSRDRPDASRLFCLEMIQGAPLLGTILDGELRTLVEQKSDVIRAWVADGKLAPVDPHHLIFALWGTTQHYADFAVQVSALTGKTLKDVAFFAQTVENVQRIVLQGVAVR